MLSFLPAPVLFVFNFLMLSVCTSAVSLLIIFLGLFRIFRIEPLNRFIDGVNQALYRFWCGYNAMLIRLTNNTQWDLKGFDELDRIKGSCVIISNHVSWTDIVMICHLYRGKIPLPKFFMKHSLIYIPFVGQVCYSLGMPFMRRYTRQQILKNPNLKNRDLETTRKACGMLIRYPSAIINFVEGTRYTKEKAEKAKSPYRHLMPPKAMSLGVALGIVGPHIDCILNTTIQYPETNGNLFLALLCGRLKKVIARTEALPVTADLVGDYTGDKDFKNAFVAKLRDMWEEKDRLICDLLSEGQEATDGARALRYAKDEATENLNLALKEADGIRAADQNGSGAGSEGEGSFAVEDPSDASKAGIGSDGAGAGADKGSKTETAPEGHIGKDSESARRKEVACGK